jgi:hypothetical protein
MKYPTSVAKALSIPAALVLVLAIWSVVGCVTTKPRMKVERTQDTLTILTPTGRPVLTYNLRPPTNSGLVVASGDYFHPLLTPRGMVVTDFAPSDHRHHRGLFLGWVEMHGPKDADFWGWGEHAPIKNRRIVTRPMFDVDTYSPEATFVAVSDWMAEETMLLEENLQTTVKATENANTIDLLYTLKPTSDITLTRWAFSGFCLRVRKDAELLFYSALGGVNLPNPSHLKPESDWPDAPWYACTLKLKDGNMIGAAVFNHPRNPPTLWHNHRDVHMINPCIVARNDVQLQKGKALRLRYRVVTFDGDLPLKILDKAAVEFARK